MSTRYMNSYRGITKELTTQRSNCQSKILYISWYSRLASISTNKQMVIGHIFHKNFLKEYLWPFKDWMKFPSIGLQKLSKINLLSQCESLRIVCPRTILLTCFLSECHSFSFDDAPSHNSCHSNVQCYFVRWKM